MDIPKKLQDEIWDYCRLNEIPNIDEFTNKMVGNGFNIEKYGNSPFGSETPEPEIIEKEVIKEIIKEVPVEKIVEKRVEVVVEVIKEVPVEVIKEVSVEKKVYITDDEQVTQLTDEITILEETLNNTIKGYDDEKEELKREYIVDLENYEEGRRLLMKELNSIKQKLDEKPKEIVGGKYKGFWEEEVEAHDKTKEEIKRLNGILNHLNGGSDDNNDIYDDESRGLWGGGSNISRKK
jgi:hypothetical protein